MSFTGRFDPEFLGRTLDASEISGASQPTAGSAGSSAAPLGFFGLGGNDARSSTRRILDNYTPPNIDAIMADNGSDVSPQPQQQQQPPTLSQQPPTLDPPQPPPRKQAQT